MTTTFLSKVREYIGRSGSVGEPVKPNEEKVYDEIFGTTEDHSNEKIKLSDVHAIIKKKVTEDMPSLLRWYRELGEDMGVRWVSEEVVIDDSVESDTSDAELESDTEQDTGEESDKWVDDEETAADEETDAGEADVLGPTPIKQEETPMTPEELIAKGLHGMLAQQKQVTVDISDSAITKLASLIRTNNDTIKEGDSTPELEEVCDTGDKYTLQNRESDIIGIPYNKIQTAVSLGLNIIYRGVPGCGKTYVANCDAKMVTGISETNRIKQIDFTENLSYSDTMVGLQQSTTNGTWKYQKGEIARFCEFALRNPNKPFVLILNEFTRANTEAVLGQMFTAMENKYRGQKFTLDNGDTFICPKNLVVLATMNGTDKGVKKLDKATEERFYIVDVQPLWGEWATSDDSYSSLIDRLEIKVNSAEDRIVKSLCGIMYGINELCDSNGILTADHQIGQRQLLQFLGQTDINGKKIEYNTTVLGIIIDQLIDRTRSLATLNDSINNKLTELCKLREGCK